MTVSAIARLVMTPTMFRALGRLTPRKTIAAPDELLRSRPWYALELAVRSGARPGGVLDRRARAELQEIAADRIGAFTAAQRRALPEGSWFYFGRSQA